MRSSWYLKRSAQKIWRTKKKFAERRGMALSKGGHCRVPKIRRSAKRVLNYFLEISYLPSAFAGALGKGISKKSNFLIPIFAECRISGHSAKKFQKKNWNFAERRVRGTRQSIFRNKNFAECQIGDTRQRFFFKKNLLCRAPGQVTLGKEGVKKIKKPFAECQIWDTRQNIFF